MQPFPGYEQQTAEALAGIPGCEVLPAQNRPAFVLVTETHGRAEQRELEERVAALAGLAAISLVSGWTDTAGVEEEPV